MTITKEQKKIILYGAGIAGALFAGYLFLRNILGFGDTPVETWRRTRPERRGRVARTRASVQELQAINRDRRREAANIARRKEQREKAEANAERIRREKIWRENRTLIEKTQG